jgi:pyruvate/2-oxoglutarate dehydrogenase complex dihydrolipoamide dehydrogenase (E3) component
MQKDYDVIYIGTGPVGVSCAKHLNSLSTNLI